MTRMCCHWNKGYSVIYNADLNNHSSTVTCNEDCNMGENVQPWHNATESAKKIKHARNSCHKYNVRDAQLNSTASYAGMFFSPHFLGWHGGRWHRTRKKMQNCEKCHDCHNEMKAQSKRLRLPRDARDVKIKINVVDKNEWTCMPEKVSKQWFYRVFERHQKGPTKSDALILHMSLSIHTPLKNHHRSEELK